MLEAAWCLVVGHKWGRHRYEATQAMTNRKASFSSASGAGRLMKAKDCRPCTRVVRGSVGDMRFEGGRQGRRMASVRSAQ
jgi:hypothetical protein